MTTALSSIRQIALTVRDVAAARRFFVEILGLEFLFDAGPALSFVNAGGVRLMLTSSGAPEAIGRNSVLYFRTDAVEAAYQSVVDRGATPERAPQLTAKMPDHELWIAFVRDPDGNLIGLMEERR